MTDIEKVEAYIGDRSSTILDLPNANLKSLILNGLTDEECEGINLKNVNLSGSDIQETDFTLVQLTDANLSGVNLSKSKFFSCDLDNVNLSGAYLSHSRMCLCGFSGGNLSNANMSNADFSSSEFVGTNLDEANLSNSEFSFAVFMNANLQFVNFENADLSNTDFTGADLSYANLTNANLVDAKLTNANFNGANLGGAKIHELDIHYVSFLGEENLRKMIIVPYIIPAYRDINCVFNSKSYCFSDDLNQSKIVAPIKAESKIKFETKINRESVEFKFSLISKDLNCLSQRNKSDLEGLALDLISENEKIIHFKSLFTEDINGERLIGYGVTIQLSDNNEVRKCTLHLFDDKVQLDFY
jgi:uncharacterized protein YjbI with pentapeptide repeats